MRIRIIIVTKLALGNYHDQISRTNLRQLLSKDEYILIIDHRQHKLQKTQNKRSLTV